MLMQLLLNDSNILRLVVIYTKRINRKGFKISSEDIAETLYRI
jgi:hypothetical protein